MYLIPKEYLQRIHHCRPRFKNNQEEVLIYMATEISKLESMKKIEFKNRVNNAIKLFPGNSNKAQKTIDNWRTEISSFFGLIQQNEDGSESLPSIMAKKLAEEQDLIQFYKYFLYYFQYPGGHLKPQENKKLIEKGVFFKPAQYILKLLEKSEKIKKSRFFITKAEVTHCIFNDLRVTRDNRNVEEVIKLIENNRILKIEYDWSGDVIRYAGDILDYMCIANLLVTYDGQKFYINNFEKETIASFINKEMRCDIYDSFYGRDDIKTMELTKLDSTWFNYVNTDLSTDLFKTDLYNYIGIPKPTYKALVQDTINEFHIKIENEEKVRTKDIGDFGESLILGHEKMRLKGGKREDLLHLIQKIPTQFAVGYDISSVELDEMKRFIEVKTTVSSKKFNFFNFHLTPNEWNAASTLKDSYYVYRLSITKNSIELHMIQNPVGLYKKDLIEMSPRDGADIKFNNDVSKKVELLIWED
ncbi:protein NO VEIN domain-containing protein [Aliarcobacter butzleri]|uniref:protein NO VEIN domain-containing protein n=1 Tax=Aliarcobacter butzleri TaxID=28197 RepID=UPI0021B2E0F4|nr:DUF3883 domain-containing protein [Aliarcobacter butzleri]MCT7581443.1 DUF3883 domain-containing protein [Aliarcobacter butzleri]